MTGCSEMKSCVCVIIVLYRICQGYNYTQCVPTKMGAGLVERKSVVEGVFPIHL